MIDIKEKMDANKVSFLTNGVNTPSSRFRVHQFLDLIKDEFRYDIHPGGFVSGVCCSSLRNVIHAADRARKIVFDGTNGSRFFVQRMLLYRNNILLEKLLFSNAKNGVIVDFDDAIFLSNPRFSYTVGNADMVVAGNTFLADWASTYSSNIKIIPTCVDSTRYHVNRSYSAHDSGNITVGWTGTKDNLIYLEHIAKSLYTLQKKYKFRFLLISDSDNTPRFLERMSVEHVRWSKSKEIEQLGAIDIGLMPLPDNDWVRGKCGFKLLQYMATGSIAIGSDIGVNNEIISDGENGFLCASLDDWYSKIEWALSNYGSHSYIDMVNKARTTVINQYSIQAHIGGFVEAVVDLK